MICTYDHEKLVEGMWEEHWELRLKWTSKPLTLQQLKPLIRTYDKVATDAVERLHEIAAPPNAKSSSRDEDIEGTMKTDEERKPHWDLYELIQEYASKDEKIGKLWAEVKTVP